MANELLELGAKTRRAKPKTKAKKRRKPRVCFKVIKLGPKNYGVATYDRVSGKRRDYLAPPCLRTTKRKKALKIPTRKAAAAYAKKCGLRCEKS